MGQNKDAAVGFLGIGIIIVIIVGVVIVLLPGEPEEEPDFQKIREQQWVEHDKEVAAEQQVELEEVKPQVNVGNEVKSASLRERYDSAVGWDAEDKVVRDWLSSYTGSGKAELTFTEAINYLLAITYTEEERNHPEASIWMEYLVNTDIPWKKGFEYSGRYVDVILHVKAGYDDGTYRWLIDLDEEIMYGTDEASNEILSLLNIE
jgi:hypothetical protein